MSHQTRREYLLSIHGRYRRADQKQKQVILNEFCANTGYHRKYAIWLLNGPPPSRVERCPRRPRPPSYGPGVVSVLAGGWEAVGYSWSVRLKALLPLWMPWIKLHFHLSPVTERQLQQISARQMDPRLRPHKQRMKRRFYALADRRLSPKPSIPSSRSVTF